nr:proline/serine-rich coiled-coil protein 1 [Zootoca vivipara]
MEWPNEDIKFIIDETLDFSLSSSSFDGQEEEEEAVSGICPTESSERCAAQSIDMNIFGGESEGKALVWSPLSPEKLEEMMREANRLAELMEGCELLEKENGSSETRLEMVPDFEPLPSIESSHAVRRDSRAPRRRTFNVSNSPLKALLPTVGPESCCSVGSPKALLPEMGSPTSCDADPPVPKRRQNKSNACIPDSQLPKKSRPNQPLRSLAATKSLDIKKTTTRCSRKERSTPPTLPTQNKKTLPSLRPPLQTNRKGPWRETEKSSGKVASLEASQVFLMGNTKEWRTQQAG